MAHSEEELEKELHVSFYIIAYKLAFGLVEFLSGLGILLFGTRALGMYRWYVSQELLEDPHDLLARLSTQLIPAIITHRTYLVISLLLLGSAKIAGAVGLIYKKTWGVDLLVGLTILMLPFQLIRLAMHPSLPDFLYIGVGLFIALYLINFKPRTWASRMRHQLKTSKREAGGTTA